MYSYININANTLTFVIEAKTNSPTLFIRFEEKKEKKKKSSLYEFILIPLLLFFFFFFNNA